ncbi:MAG: hypothetical protein AAF492_12140, partial [Verrucomicrobiota bacterium]
PNLFRDPKLSFELQGQFSASAPAFGHQQFVNSKRFNLRPKQKLAILGAAGIAKNIDFRWKYPVEDNVMFRVIYNASQSDPSSIIVKSDWVPIKVVPKGNDDEDEDLNDR